MRHVLTQGNITGGQLIAALKENYPQGVDFCYTDPPWGDGNLRYWATINKKMTASAVNQIDQPELEKETARLISDHVKHYAFVVYGVNQAESLMAVLRSKNNVVDVQYISKKYRSGSKWLENCVIPVTLNDAPIIDWRPVLENKNGMAGLKAVCEMFKGRYTSCLDAFIGQGFYLETLHKYGFAVVGNELNAARVEKAKSRVGL